MESLTQKTSPVSYNDLTNLYNEARSLLFPNFPIFNEEHRIPLENLIMNHFLTREICMTPYARWQVAFNNKMQLIMPYYNTLYESIAGINLFDDVNFTREAENSGSVIMKKGTTDKSSQSGTSSTSGSFTPGTQQVVSNTTTPQGNLTDFLNDSYVSSASKSNTSGEDTSLNTVDTSGEGQITRSGQDENVDNRSLTETVKGKRGSKSYFEMIQETNGKIFTVDQMILDSLEELFFSIY